MMRDDAGDTLRAGARKINLEMGRSWRCGATPTKLLNPPFGAMIGPHARSRG
jgi:hypothetical protein